MDLTHSKIFGGITVLNSVVNNYQYAPHWHNRYVLAIYRDGAKQFKCAQYTGIAVAGDLLIIAPGTLHSATTLDNNGWDYCALNFTTDQLSKAMGFSERELDERFQDFSHIKNNKASNRKVFDALDAGKDTELALSDWLLSIASQSSTVKHQKIQAPSALKSVYQRIMDDPVSNITMAELSFLAGVSHEHLSRSFKQVFGVSPFQLIIAARIQIARKHINLGISFADAALIAGFSDQSHMNRWLKRAYGVSPRFLKHINCVQDG